MYCSRPVARSPSIFRVVKSPALNQAVRNASFVPAPFFGGRHGFGGDFAPLFRALDEFTNPRAFDNLFPAASRQTFSPRFDVREVGDRYELRGELPGVDAANLEVEFSDAQTLVIRGRTQRESSTRPAAAAVEGTEAPKAVEAEKDSDAVSNYSTGSYQQPSVEDAEPETQETPATAEAPTPAPKAPEQEPEQPQGTYWVSERSTGSFERTFGFQDRVDQAGVKASLKNGILDIVVPKAAVPAARRINVE